MPELIELSAESQRAFKKAHITPEQEEAIGREMRRLVGVRKKRMPRTYVKVDENNNQIRKNIVRALKAKPPKTIRELADECGIRGDTINGCLGTMLSHGLVRKIGKCRPFRWELT